ncbi:MFS transporter [Xylogone sp. PMI_703]|nr:MFS transporter [Xylogone sp. PMI_703]
MYQIGNLYGIAAVAIVGGGLFGFDISSMSAIISTQQYLCYFNSDPSTYDPTAHTQQCAGPTSSTQGGITASMAGGSFVGALISGYCSDTLGRKKAIQIGSVIWCIGSILVCASQNIGMLVVGRFINGISVGICSAQVPVYITEVAPPTKRGRLVGAQQWAITWGILIMFYVSYGCSFIGRYDHPPSPTAFRLPWGLQMIPAIFLFFAMFLLPESPRWLAKKDRWEEAEAVIALVHAKGDRSHPFVMREMQEIRDFCEFERQNADVSYLELLKPNMINRTHISIFTQFWSQLTGMNVIMYYITYVFAMAGLKGNNALISSSINYVINVFMTIPALLFVDRWGRRTTLVCGAISLMIWWYITAGILATYGHHAPPGGLNHVSEESWLISGAPSKAVIACSYLIVASFAPSWGPVSWIYPPELFPLRLRAKGVSVSTAACWIMNFALGYFTPPAFTNIAWKIYLVFGIFCTAMAVHSFLCFPETAGKPLEEIEEMFASGVPAWKTHGSFSTSRLLERGEFDSEKQAGIAREEVEDAAAVPVTLEKAA